MPAVHALSGCDTTSKVATKASALHTAEKTGYEQLQSFGKRPISEEIIAAAQKFLVDCISKDSKVQTFDELRFQTYHSKNFQLDFEKLPCTSRSIRLHIKRAYLQTFRWFNAASILWIMHTAWMRMSVLYPMSWMEIEYQVTSHYLAIASSVQNQLCVHVESNR